jgi:hypothetical protein
MAGAGRWRVALFLGCGAALLLAALAFSLGARQQSTPPTASAGSREPPALRLPRPTRRALARAERRSASLRRSARRFLAAFSRYEVGEGGRALDVVLRAAATPAFARRLLAAPPRAPPALGGYPPPARLGGLRITFLSAGGNRALVTASARRGARPEQLAFLFKRLPRNAACAADERRTERGQDAGRSNSGHYSTFRGRRPAKCVRRRQTCAGGCEATSKRRGRAWLASGPGQ